MKATFALLLLCVLAATTRAQQAAADARINELGRKLEQATRPLDQLKDTVQTLRAEIELIRERKTNEAPQQTTTNKIALLDESRLMLRRKQFWMTCEE